MHLWFWLTLISGLIFGFYDITKKTALGKSALLNVLFMHSFLCFVLVSFELPHALDVSYQNMALFIFKALCIFFSWILSFIALRNMPISVFTPFATLTPVFSIILGFFILGERMGVLQWSGIIVILTAFYFIGKADRSDTDKSNPVITDSEKRADIKNIIYVAVSCFLGAASAIADKIALKTTTPGIMQFWFYFYLTLCYLASYAYKKLKKENTVIFRFNRDIILISVFLVASDWLYFAALKIPNGQVSIVLPLRRVSVLVSTIYGGIIFKEKNLRTKFIYLCLVIVGIVIVFMGR